VPITTKVVSLNPVHGKVYSIQHYVIKFASNLWPVSVSPVSSTNKTDRHDIIEILLKVALNTINQPTNSSKGTVLLLLFYISVTVGSSTTSTTHTLK
jgi:hypothetical protein